MGVRRRFLSRIFRCWRRKPTNVSDLEKLPVERLYEKADSHLEKLPVELLYEIADFLAAPDRCCLSLCSHRLFNVFGHRSRLEPKTEQWGMFLQRLSRDLPRHVYCHACSVIHECKHILPSSMLPDPPHLLEHDELAKLHRLKVPVQLHPWEWTYCFSHIHLQLAMKRHFCGPAHGISTESLAYVEILPSSLYPLTALLSVDAQICHGPRLCLRIQSWSLVKDFAPSSFTNVLICYHLYAGSAPAVELIQSEWDICESRSEKPSDPNIYQCSICGIDYQIEVVDCDSKGTALIITKWLDLGSGLDPNDPGWKRHFFGYSFRLENEATKSDGTLRSQFEQKSAVSLDALTHRNASLLKSYESSSKTVSEGNKATPDYRKGRMSNLFRPAWGSYSLSSILF
jgi:hypothetical protein